ncbi:MAG: LytTR family transcriptional regulator DNA-binding domain-containing protein [bacterium]|nr:LytTR family transcriptional regulator DNA-binding domain-containing protein [bacterium]
MNTFCIIIKRTLFGGAYNTNIDIVQQCNDGFEGVKAIQVHQPDLIFLDIQMPKLNGFEMLELIENAPKVIFTTAFDEYALKAFESNAVDYLLKPFSKERFDQALKKCLSTTQNTEAKSEALHNTNAKQPEEGNRIVVKVNGTIKIIPIQEVMYIEAYDDYVKIYTEQACHVKKKTMAWYERSLDTKTFARIHRSYILNLSYLTRIQQTDKEGHSAILKNGNALALSRSGYGLLKERLGI